MTCRENRAGIAREMRAILGGEPLRWHKLFGHSFRFLKVFLHLLAGEGVWGRGRHLSPFPL
jgi:hypothetical protein